MSASATTLLWLIRTTAPPDPGHPHAIGVDEWAWRRGDQCGTLIVDLKTHRVLDLLPDRAATTVATWLRQHPTIQVICWDRFAAYADAATSGAPQAIQVADRFHLVQNLADVLLSVFQQHPTILQVGAAATAQQQPGPVVLLESASDHMTQAHHQQRSPRWQQTEEVRQQQRLAQRRAAYVQVHELRQQGWTVAAIARQLGVSRKTVYVYLRQDQPPSPRRHQRRRSDRVLAPYEAYLRAQWEVGGHTSSYLWRAIQAQGYRGSQRTVTRFVHQLRQDARDGVAAGREISPITRRRGPAARDGVHLLLRPPCQCSMAERQYLHQRMTQSPVLAVSCELTETFLAMVRERDGAHLQDWMTRVALGGCASLQRFARGLRTDLSAVQAALTLPWSNGVTEGHVHRLKLLKRQSYGRAGFATLWARVLHAG